MNPASPIILLVRRSQKWITWPWEHCSGHKYESITKVQILITRLQGCHIGRKCGETVIRPVAILNKRLQVKDYICITAAGSARFFWLVFFHRAHFCVCAVFCYRFSEFHILHFNLDSWIRNSQSPSAFSSFLWLVVSPATPYLTALQLVFCTSLAQFFMRISVFPASVQNQLFTYLGLEHMWGLNPLDGNQPSARGPCEIWAP